MPISGLVVEDLHNGCRSFTATDQRLDRGPYVDPQFAEDFSNVKWDIIVQNLPIDVANFYEFSFFIHNSDEDVIPIGTSLDETNLVMSTTQLCKTNSTVSIPFTDVSGNTPFLMRVTSGGSRALYRHESLYRELRQSMHDFAHGGVRPEPAAHLDQIVRTTKKPGEIRQIVVKIQIDPDQYDELPLAPVAPDLKNSNEEGDLRCMVDSVQVQLKGSNAQDKKGVILALQLTETLSDSFSIYGKGYSRAHLLDMRAIDWEEEDIAVSGLAATERLRTTTCTIHLRRRFGPAKNPTLAGELLLNAPHDLPSVVEIQLTQLHDAKARLEIQLTQLHDAKATLEQDAVSQLPRGQDGRYNMLKLMIAAIESHMWLLSATDKWPH